VDEIIRTEVTSIRCPIVLLLVPAVVDEPGVVVELELLDGASEPITSISCPLCCASSDSCPWSMYVEPRIDVEAALPVPAVPAAEPVVLDEPGVLLDALVEGAPIRAFVSIHWPLDRTLDPVVLLLVVPLVPVAPGEPPPSRHPVTVMERALPDVAWLLLVPGACVPDVPTAPLDVLVPELLDPWLAEVPAV
jgi:hypothetical protein